MPLDRRLTGAVGMMFLLTAHMDDWPVAAGGSRDRRRAGQFVALARRTRADGRAGALGGRFAGGAAVSVRHQPVQAASIAGSVLPERYVRRLQRFRYGPGVFKLDWALDGSIPWERSAVLGGFDGASGRHVGGDRGRGGCGVARRASRATVGARVSAERVSIRRERPRESKLAGLIATCRRDRRSI